MEIFHDSHNIIFREPFGAVLCGETVTLRLAIRAVDSTRIRVRIRLWLEGREELVLMRPMDVAVRSLDLSSEDYAFWEGAVVAPDQGGVFWYYFVVDEVTGPGVGIVTGDVDVTDAGVEDGWNGLRGFRYFYGDNGRRLGGIGALAGSVFCEALGGCSFSEEPPAYQITVSSRDNVVPDWYKQGIMYQIFVDRFHRGEGPRWQHALPGRKALFHQDWEDTPFYLRNGKGGIDRWLFFGGNLDGVRLKLGYLRGLGVTILYLNPIFEAASNHKYDTGDYLKVDPMFGDEQSLRLLVEEAREQGISIVLDGVFSHTGADSLYFNRAGFYPSVGAFQSEASPYAGWFQFERFPDTYTSWWGIIDLPNVNELEPSFLDFVCRGSQSVVRSWMRRGIRGWRLDVADELPEAFIRCVRRAMVEEDPEGVLIGEVWEDASHKVSYGEMRRYFAGDELHGTMNYPFRALLLDFLVYRISTHDLCAGLMSLYENYPRENFYGAMNLLGSHDVERVLTLLGDPPAAEGLSDEEKRVFKLPAGSRVLAVKRLNMMVLWQMAFPGVPCVYYGDEAGMEGFRDPYNRGTFPWGREDEEIQSLFRRWMWLRREYRVLRDGDLRLVWAEDVCGFWRTLDNGSPDEERILVLVNRSEAGLKYVLGGVGVEGSGFSRPVWSRPPDWDGAVHSWEIVDLDSGGCEGIWDLAQVSLSVDVPALSARVLLFRGARATAKPPWLNRVAGVLLPVASLPSRYGVGDFGGAAYRFVDVLVEAGQKVWQLLPLNPPDHVHSPYQSAGAMAISSLYIDPEQLTAVLRKAFPELAEMVSRVVDGTDDGLMWEPTMARIDYAQAKRLKARVLQRAFAVWSLGREGRLDGCEDRLDQSVGLLQAYDEFCEVNAYWLEDYALFCALKNEQEGSVWQLWDEGLRGREEKALAAARLRLQAEVEAVLFEQFIVHKQFEALRGYANERGLLIMGDVPFYVAADSADCWAHQEMFWLREGVPTLVAGVPPDAFAEDGQRWGNPLYRWDVMETDGFSWWCDRMRRGFALFDFVRLDHFRGFAAYWEIPAHREDAREGQWVKGPGRFFFEVLRRELGEKAQGIVAEDLGFWTPEVKILRELAGVPGMRVLQFEDGNTDIEEDTVFFSGTHDNGTLYQWMVDRDSNKTDVFPSADNVSGADGPEGRESERCRSSCRELVESMYSSRAGLIILPVQDVLLLDERARINVPGTDQGNWAWRMEEAAMSDSAWQWLGELARRTGRGSNQIRF